MSNKTKDWSNFVIPNGKYDLLRQKKILSQLKTNDYKFIESFMKNYHLREGIGIYNILALMLAEYKFRTRKVKPIGL